MTLPTTPSLTELINMHLDADYKRIAERNVLQPAVRMASAPNSPIQLALQELDEETARLEQAKQPLKSSNATLQKVIRVFGELFTAIAVLIQTNADALEQSGQNIAVPAVTSKVFLNVTGQILQGGADPIASMGTYTSVLTTRGITWSADITVNKFTSMGAWRAKMEGWGKGYAELIDRTIKTGIQKGWNPRYTASYLRQYTVDLPYAAAENITRTLQLSAYREASLAMELANPGMILKKIRIATLDRRTCLACISLHGTELEPGQRVDDHYRGRCSEYYVVPGGADHPTFMQADSPSGGRKYVEWQSGVDWFNSLPPARQQQQASFLTSPGKWNAFQSGVPISAFVTNVVDPVFGNQIVENSIIGALGEEGTQYYARNFEPK